MTAQQAGTPGAVGGDELAARHRGNLLVVVAVIGVLAVVSAASVLIGSQMMTAGHAVAAVFDPSDPAHAIVAARSARTALAIVVGGALALSGALMQGLTRNPIADPGILGVNAGAAFAVVLAISVFDISRSVSYIWFAFVGAAAAMALVHGIAAVGRGGATPAKLAISGAALTAATGSWTSGVLLTDQQTVQVFRLWQVGTVAGRGSDALLTGLPFLLVGLIAALSAAPMMNALALGDDVARGMGRTIWRDRLVVGTAIVLLAGTATALAGPIAFVGLIVPHALRFAVGPDYRRVLPLSVGCGAALTVAADVVGRVILPPSEVQVGIMTAVIGVPVFLWVIRRGRLGAL